MARVPKQEAALSLKSLQAYRVPFFLLRNTGGGCEGRVHDVSFCSDNYQKKIVNFTRIGEI